MIRKKILISFILIIFLFHMLIPFLNIVQAADGTGVYKFNDTNLYNALVEQ